MSQRPFFAPAFVKEMGEKFLAKVDRLFYGRKPIPVKRPKIFTEEVEAM